MSPTEGTAIVTGHDIRSAMHQIRHDMGVCMQHDCIFPSLTVREHLQLFCRIKGLYSRKSESEAEHQISQSLREVALEEKSSSLAKNLSGGMKRKLNVAMAFCGENKIVILVRLALISLPELWRGLNAKYEYAHLTALLSGRTDKWDGKFSWRARVVLLCTMH